MGTGHAAGPGGDRPPRTHRLPAAVVSLPNTTTPSPRLSPLGASHQLQAPPGKGKAKRKHLLKRVAFPYRFFFHEEGKESSLCLRGSGGHREQEEGKYNPDGARHGPAPAPAPHRPRDCFGPGAFGPRRRGPALSPPARSRQPHPGRLGRQWVSCSSFFCSKYK